MTHLLKPFQRPNITPPDEALRELEEYARQQAEREGQAASAEKQEPKPENNTSNLVHLEDKIMWFDIENADNDSKKSQKEWIEYWHQVPDRRRMATLPDLYLVGKYGDDSLLENLRSSLMDCTIITGTRIIKTTSSASSPTFDAGIAHHSKSQYELAGPVPFPKKRTEVMQGTFKTTLSQCLAARKDHLYLQALFQTTDNAKTITKTLERLIGLDKDNINILTPSYLDDNVNWATGLRSSPIICDTLHVYCSLYYDSFQGYSRGVSFTNIDAPKKESRWSKLKTLCRSYNDPHYT